MGAIINASIDIAAIPKEKIQLETENGKRWYKFQIFINDESRFGNNCWLTDDQSKEEREAKLRKLSLGNASVVWIDNGSGKGVLKEGTIQLVVKDQKNNVVRPTQIVEGISEKEIIAATENNDLPF